MKKIILLFLVLTLCGCKTFSQQGLLEHNLRIYKEGKRDGFYLGRLYEIRRRLKELNKELEVKLLQWN